MTRILSLLLFFFSLSSFAAPVTFEWEPGAGYPEGVTYELYGNSESATGITELQHTLDIPGNPGDGISAGVRAIPPAGYQCGDPPEECQPSDYATLETVLPGLAYTTPEDQYGLCATAEENGGQPVALAYVQAKTGNSSGGDDATVTLDAAPTDGNLLIAGLSYWNGDTDSPFPFTSTGFSYLLDYPTNQTSTNGIAIYTKVAGASESAAITFTGDRSENWALTIIEISGQDDTAPINKQVTSATLATGSATPDVIGTLPIAFLSSDSIASSVSAGAGWTVRAGGGVGSYHSVHVATRNTLTSDTSTAISTTFSGTNISFQETALLLIAPAEEGGITESGEISETASAIAFTPLSASASGSLSSQASAVHAPLYRAMSVGSIVKAAAAATQTHGTATLNSSYQDIALSSALHSAVASAMSEYLSVAQSGDASGATADASSTYTDGSQASETPPSRAQAIAHVIALALSSDAHDADLGTVLGQVSEAATTSDVFNAIATAYAAISQGVLNGEQWVNTIAAGGTIALVATAEDTSTAASVGAQDGAIEAQSDALAAFLASVQALASMADGATANDVTAALVEAAGAIAEATSAADVYDALAGDSDRAITESATAQDMSGAQASALSELLESIFAAESTRATSAAIGAVDSDATSASDSYQSTLSDLERAISEAALATHTTYGQASVYSALVDAISAATSANAQAATIVGILASAYASSSFTISDVEDARLERLYLASISVSKAITAQLGIGLAITGTITV